MLNLNPDDLTKAWKDGTLERNTIYDYLAQNLSVLSHMVPRELEHVADLCFSLYEWSAKGGHLGDFLTAVVKNDLKEAVGRADNVNQKQLWVYPTFIYNCAPAGWKDGKNEKDS